VTFFTAGVTRGDLSLGDLNINDVIYRVATIEPGAQAFRRQTASSPYVDGVFTTNRARDIRQLSIAVDVGGADAATTRANMGVLIDAFEQDYFELYWAIDGDPIRWAGEAADRQVDYTQERIRARRAQVIFTVPVQPVLLQGRL